MPQVEIDYLDDVEGEFIVLMTPRLRLRAESQLKGIQKKLLAQGVELDRADLTGLSDDVVAAVMDAVAIQEDLDGDATLRAEFESSVRSEVFRLRTSTYELSEELRRRTTNWRADLAPDEEGTTPARAEDPWRVASDLLHPVRVTPGTDPDEPLRIEVEMALYEVCLDLLRPFMSQRRRFFSNWRRTN